MTGSTRDATAGQDVSVAAPFVGVFGPGLFAERRDVGSQYSSLWLCAEVGCVRVPAANNILLRHCIGFLLGVSVFGTDKHRGARALSFRPDSLCFFSDSQTEDDYLYHAM